MFGYLASEVFLAVTSSFLLMPSCPPPLLSGASFVVKESPLQDLDFEALQISSSLHRVTHIFVHVFKERHMRQMCHNIQVEHQQNQCVKGGDEISSSLGLVQQRGALMDLYLSAIMCLGFFPHV